MRDRLIELIDNWYTEYFNIYQECDDETAAIAGYLLENGVIVPPVKVGDIVWYIDTNYNIQKAEVPGKCESSEMHLVWRIEGNVSAFSSHKFIIHHAV